jgi:hypothetical protein
VVGKAAADGTWGDWVLLRNDTHPIDQLVVGRFNTADNKADVFWADGNTWRYRKNGTHTTWLVLNSADPWSNLTLQDLAFGDFDADGVTDVFSADGSAWRYHPAGTGAVTLSTPNDLRVAKLRLADLNGDGKTDVFYGNGERWRYKSAGAGSWLLLGLAAEESHQLWLGSFDEAECVFRRTRAVVPAGPERRFRRTRAGSERSDGFGSGVWV